MRGEIKAGVTYGTRAPSTQKKLSLSLSFFSYSARARAERQWKKHGGITDSNEHVKNAGTKSNGGGRMESGGRIK